MEKIVRAPAPPGIDFSKNWADFSREEKNQIRDALLEMTGGRCAYTGKKIDKELAVIDHFRPLKINQSSGWNDLYVINPITEHLKSDKYDEKLIRPDETDYEFDRYFDFDKNYIIPNPNANSDDKERAIITIDTFGLNHENTLSDRSRELSKFLGGIRQQIAKMPENEKDKSNRKIRVDFSNFSYLSYLKKVYKKLSEQFRNSNEYVNNINIEKYFCVEDFKVKNLQNRREIYFLGENGDGKTIVLQAIILALKGLSDKFIYKYANIDYNNFAIEIGGEKQRIYKYNFIDNVDSDANSIHTDVYAYGVGRLRNHKDHDDEGYLTLFDYDAYLTNPVEWFKEVDRLENKGISKLKLSTVKKIFEELLENKVNIEETPEGDYIFKEKNTILEFRQLSDGYRSVLIWLSDLLSRLAKNQPEVERLADYKAVVLVDEIGSFLHPRWEYTIVGKLRKLFPKIQWFFTTHSPIITLGASEDAVFYKIYKEDGITKVSEPFHAEFYANRLLSNFVTSPLFNLETARPAAFDEDRHEDLETGNYLYSQIHKQVKERMKNKPLQEEEIRNVIDEILNKLEKAGQI